MAVVAAESPEIAYAALDLIEVDYEVLEPVLDPLYAISGNAPVIHDEADIIGGHNVQRNIVHHIDAHVGDEAQQWGQAVHVFEHEYRVHQVQQASIEPHIVVTWWDGMTAWSFVPAHKCPSTFGGWLPHCWACP
ncbi:MAG UNVERIFIED_CONTAM: molybdopterin-dependent oxidoreductase [Anaerolineae bacterium]